MIKLPILLFVMTCAYPLLASDNKPEEQNKFRLCGTVIISSIVTGETVFLRGPVEAAVELVYDDTTKEYSGIATWQSRRSPGSAWCSAGLSSSAAEEHFKDILRTGPCIAKNENRELAKLILAGKIK